MAILKKKNLLFRGFSGQFGKQAVLRQRDGKTILSDFPVKTEMPPTEKQIAHRERFSNAAAYAELQMADAASREAYQKEARRRKMASAYLAAVTDFLTVPEITHADVDAYRGQVGDKIEIVVDDMSVTSVVVEIIGGNGGMIETGAAIAHDESNTVWTYTAQAAGATWGGGKAIVKAYDRPKNESVREFAFPVPA
jgi:hypothetical protein